MIKKFSAFILCVAFCLVMVSCGNGGGETETITGKDSPGETETTTNENASAAKLDYSIEADRIFFKEIPLTGDTYSAGSRLFEHAVIERDGKYGLIGMDGEIKLDVIYSQVNACGCKTDILAFCDAVTGYDVMINESLKKDFHGGHGLMTWENIYDEDADKAFLVGNGEAFCDIKDIEGGVQVVEGGVRKVDVEWAPDGYYEETGRYGIYKNGGLIVALDYPQADAFSEGLAAFINEDGKWGYYDENGNLVIPFECDGIKNRDWNWGGDIKIPYRCYEGYISACVDGKWGCFDKEGNVVVPFVYEGISQVKDGKVFVKNDGKWVAASISELMN